MEALTTVLGILIFIVWNYYAEVKHMVEFTQQGRIVEVNYQILSNKEESKKRYDEVLEKVEENAKVMKEVRFSINEKDNIIRTRGKKHYLSIDVIYQDSDLIDDLINAICQAPDNKKSVKGMRYSGDYVFGWRSEQKMEIASAENFKLEDYLFDFNQVSFDLFHKVITDAFTKYKDETKYEYQYVKSVDINKDRFRVTIHGKLKSNGVEKSEYYEADLKGNKVED